jgi:cytoskeletal protein CcmA (bactofilin family)
MSIFKKSDPAPAKPRERTSGLPRSGSGDAAISIIGAGMRVIGDIVTEGTVRIEGEVRGTIRAGKSVVLGQGGRVEGDIDTEDAVIGGEVEGTITAGSRLELQSTCSVVGELRTRSEHFRLEEGARFSGQVLMLDPAEGPKAAESRPPAISRVPITEEPPAPIAPEKERVAALSPGR